MENKFKVGEIVRQVKNVGAFEDSICKIVEIKGDMVYHIHKNYKAIRCSSHLCDFKKLPDILKQILLW